MFWCFVYLGSTDWSSGISFSMEILGCMGNSCKSESMRGMRAREHGSLGAWEHEGMRAQELGSRKKGEQESRRAGVQECRRAREHGEHEGMRAWENERAGKRCPSCYWDGDAGPGRHWLWLAGPDSLGKGLDVQEFRYRGAPCVVTIDITQLIQLT